MRKYSSLKEVEKIPPFTVGEVEFNIEKLVFNVFPNMIQGAGVGWSPVWNHQLDISAKYGKEFLKQYKAWANADSKAEDDEEIPDEYFNVNSPHLKRYLLEKL